MDATKVEQIAALRALPGELEQLVSGLSPAQLTTPFLAGEWTIAQNVHHVLDAHTNAYIRLCLALTEVEPPLRAYDQDAWAALPGNGAADVSDTLAMLHLLHKRMANRFAALDEAEWGRIGMHSVDGPWSVASMLARFVGHGRAHLNQIQRTLAAEPR